MSVFLYLKNTQVVENNERINFICNRLAYYLRLTWWSSEKILKLGLPKHEEIIRVKPLSSILKQDCNKESIASIVLSSLESHSSLYVLAPWLLQLNETELVQLLKSKPVLCKDMEDKVSYINCCTFLLSRSQKVEKWNWRYIEDFLLAIICYTPYAHRQLIILILKKR